MKLRGFDELLLQGMGAGPPRSPGAELLVGRSGSEAP